MPRSDAGQVRDRKRTPLVVSLAAGQGAGGHPRAVVSRAAARQPRRADPWADARFAPPLAWDIAILLYRADPLDAVPDPVVLHLLRHAAGTQHGHSGVSGGNLGA